jgi:hypothetical protein
MRRRKRLPAAISRRCEFVGGDFFKAIPRGADAYRLKYILHDWDDEKSRAILGRIREAVAPSAKLLVVEDLGFGPNAPCETKLGDVNMLAQTGGRNPIERSIGRCCSQADARSRPSARFAATSSCSKAVRPVKETRVSSIAGLESNISTLIPSALRPKYTAASSRSAQVVRRATMAFRVYGLGASRRRGASGTSRRIRSGAPITRVESLAFIGGVSAHVGGRALRDGCRDTFDNET